MFFSFQDRYKNRDRHDRHDRYDRYSDRDKYSRDERMRMHDDPTVRKRKDDKNDKYMGSLSEGQKRQDKESSSGSDVGDIDIDDEDEEEKIIEMRRKKREELLKVISYNHTKSFIRIDLFYFFDTEIVGWRKRWSTEKAQRFIYR